MARMSVGNKKDIRYQPIPNILHLDMEDENQRNVANFACVFLHMASTKKQPNLHLQ